MASILFVPGAEAQDPITRRLGEIGQEFGHGHALELARIEAALERMGRPQDRLPPIIHVAGTNGKGSVCAFLRAIAEAAGLRAHVFTSPHLVRVHERIRLAGRLVTDEEFLDALDRVAAAGGEITYFEAITAAAFDLFARTPADLVILETGLGGRVDATNVVDPALCVITPIALDHAHLLGPDVGAIAREKAGILKPGRPALLARQPPAAHAALVARASAIGAPLLVCGEEWDAWAAGGRLLVQTQERLLDLPLPALVGPHQIENAGLAARAALALGDGRITESAIGRGVAGAHWPARMQNLTAGPLAEPVLAAGGELWLDGGHNPHAGRALAATLAALSRVRPAPVVLICAMLANKDQAGYLAPLRAAASDLVAVPVRSSRAALPPEDLCAIAAAQGFKASPAHSLQDAIAATLRLASRPRIVLCGSLYMAGEALALSGAAPL